MEIQITREELQKRSIFLGLPCYGGNCNANFARSIADLASVCTSNGIKLQMYFLMNESLIQRARNYIADEFVRSECTHLMFIDSDIGFNPQDVLMLLAMASEESPYDIVGGAYPKKAISWEKVLAAANAGVCGDNNENPNVLENFVGDFVFNPKAGNNSFALNDPVEVLEIGTGFMMVQKRVFHKFTEQFPEKLYRPDHVRTEHFDGSREITAYFDCVIDPATKRYLSEDYYFCQKVQEMGMKTWLCPWMQLQHVGAYTFGGSLAALASIQVAATADPSKLSKTTPPANQQLAPPTKQKGKHSSKKSRKK